MPRREAMTPVDISWLRMDRPTNRMVVVSVLILAGPLDLTRIERTVERRLMVHPRFRQRIVRTPTGFWWVDDPQFDITRHIKRTRLAGKGDKAALQDLVAELASLPLDEAHPLWEYRFVEDYDGGAAVIARSSHAVADGMALVHVLLSLTDDRPDAPESPPSARAGVESWPARVQAPGSATMPGLGLAGSLWRAVAEVAASPAKALEYARQGTGVAAELAWLLTMPSDTPTRFKGKPMGQKRVAWTDPLPLPEVKAVSRVLGCSVNDLLLASVAGALGKYLADKGDATADVELRAVVPVNLRALGDEAELGNRFGVVGIELPVGIENPLARLYEVRRRMEQLKQSYEPPVTLGLFAALGYTPQLVQDQLFDFLLSRATAIMTNVPGPQHALYIGGARIRQMMFWVPQSGGIGMGVSILSFDGQVQFGLMTDAALVPDPEAVIAHFQPEFEKLLYFVLLEIAPPD